MQSEVKEADGATLGSTEARKTARPRQSRVASATVEVPVGAPPVNPIRSSCPVVELTTYSVEPSRNMPRVLAHAMLPPAAVYSTPPMMPLSGENQRQ